MEPVGYILKSLNRASEEDRSAAPRYAHENIYFLQKAYLAPKLKKFDTYFQTSSKN